MQAVSQSYQETSGWALELLTIAPDTQDSGQKRRPSQHYLTVFTSKSGQLRVSTDCAAPLGISCVLAQ